MNYLCHLCVYFAIYAVIAMSLNIVVGYCGLLTMAQAAYFGIGCYVYALTTLKLGCNFWLALVISFSVASFLSLAISLPAWRLKGDSFVLISLAVQELWMSVFQNWTTPGAEPGTWANLTNGPFGLFSIPRPAMFGVAFDEVSWMAGLSICIFALLAIALVLLLRSPWARLLQAMRDDELAVRGLGKNVRLAKLQAIAISCGLAAIAGAIYASYVNYIDPTVASLDESMLVLSMVLVGGLGNFRGPIIGAAVLIAIPEILRFAAIPDTVAANVRLIIFGILLILTMHFRPQGLAGNYRLS